MREKTIGKFAVAFAVCILGVVGIYKCYNYYGEKAQADNHVKIQEYINKELTFEEDNLEDELADFQAWIATPHVSDSDMGLLYERVSNIYKFQGKTIEYYETLGCALYYLDKSGNVNVAANIYADLANYYVTNNCYERAQEMMNRIYEMTEVERMEDLQIKSYIYRLQAVLDIHDGQYEQARELLARSREVVDQSHTGIWEGAYYAMIDIQSAHVCYETGDYAGAQKMIDDYADSPFFTQPVFANILARDFAIPYYEVACRLAARTQDRALEKPLIDNFVECCETYGFYKSELDTLLYLIEHLPPKTQAEADGIYAIINRAYLAQTDMQTQEYTGLIDGQLKEAIEQKKLQDVRLYEQRRRRGRIALYTSIVLIFIALLLLTICRSFTDGLTKLRNRSCFNRRMWLLRRTQTPYGIIMMDIDNFKHINDTYGHPTGDRVLQKLARILKSAEGKRFLCYRYGGEEFVLVSTDTQLEAVVAVGELIRKELEAQKWEFEETVTVSLGVAISDMENHEPDMVSAADQNLYYAKEHGKNTLCYMQGGETCMTRCS